MNHRGYEYFWDDEKQLFILMNEGHELDEYRTEKDIKMYAKDAIRIDKPEFEN